MYAHAVKNRSKNPPSGVTSTPSAPSNGACVVHNHEAPPLQKASQAAEETLRHANILHVDALSDVQSKINKAKLLGRFTMQFRFSDLQNLNASSHEEFAGFVAIIMSQGYKATYHTPKGETDTKLYNASTTITVDWSGAAILPK
jgi:hypothetical protein